MATFEPNFYAASGHQGDYSQPLMQPAFGNQDFAHMSSGLFPSPSYFSMEHQPSSSGSTFSSLSISPFDISVNGQTWDELEVATSASMDYSETAPSVSMESIVNFEYKPMLEGMDKYNTSPVSPNFSSVGLADPMSPEYGVNNDVNDMNDYQSLSSPESQFSDDILEDLLINLKATDGKYRCADVKAEDHSCDYAAERKCMLRKHLESTLRTNVCHHENCNGAQFSSKAVLTRHEKETHGMHEATVYRCPVTACERHTRTFPREYNMLDHIQRVHKDIDIASLQKKSKRSKRHHSSSSASASTRHSVSSGSASARKSSAASARSTRPQKMLEKHMGQFKACQEEIRARSMRITELSATGDFAEVEMLKNQLDSLIGISQVIRQHQGLFTND